MANIPSLSTFPLAAVYAQARMFGATSQVRSGFALTAVGAGSLGITVAAGTAWVDSVYLSYAGGTVTPGAASATLARYDLIVVLSGAVVPSIVAGTAAAAPVPPSLATGALFLGYVFIGPGATDYTVTATALIADYTMPIVNFAGAAATPAQIYTGDLDTGEWHPAADTLAWSVNATERMRLSSLGLNFDAAATSNVFTGVDSVAPTTISFGDTASLGTVTTAARRDHRHGMPNPAMVQLAEVVTSVSVAAVTFSAIVSTYEHLLIMWQGLTMTGGADLNIRFNGDATSIYDWTRLLVTSATTETTTIGANQAAVGRIADDTQILSGGTIYINSYARTTNVKAARASAYAKTANTSAGMNLAEYFGSWRSSAGVSQISLIPELGDWASGAVVTLYGLD